MITMQRGLTMKELEEQRITEKRGERRLIFWSLFSMILSLAAWVFSNIMVIKWLQYVSITVILLHLIIFLIGFFYGMIKLSEWSI